MNQAHNAPQPLQPQNVPAPQQHPMMVKGKSLFDRLQQNRDQQYERFRNLSSMEMMTDQIDCLWLWKLHGEPHTIFGNDLIEQHLTTLKKIKSSQQKRVKHIPGVILELMRWLRSQRQPSCAQHTKLANPKKKAALSGQHRYPSEGLDFSYKSSGGLKINTEEDEKKPLKEQ